MAFHTQRETRTGYPTFGLPSGSRAGVGFDPALNPQLLDSAGNSVLAATPTLVTLSVGGVERLRLTPTVSPVASLRLAIAGSAGASAVFASVVNPVGVDVYITRAILVVTTASTGAATVSVGTAADAITANGGLIDTKSVASTGAFDNLVSADAGASGKTLRLCSAGTFLNVSETSGDVAGLLATLIVQYVRFS